MYTRRSHKCFARIILRYPNQAYMPFTASYMSVCLEPKKGLFDMIRSVFRRLCIALILTILVFNITSLTSQARTTQMGTPLSHCSGTLKWFTEGLYDQGAINNTYHLHVQLQALFDSTGIYYCNRVIANAYLDIPSGGCCNDGILQASLWGVDPNGNVSGIHADLPCNVPDSSCLLSGYSNKYISGGPGNSVAEWYGSVYHKVFASGYYQSTNGYVSLSGYTNGYNGTNPTIYGWPLPPFDGSIASK